MVILAWLCITTSASGDAACCCIHNHTWLHVWPVLRVQQPCSCVDQHLGRGIETRCNGPDTECMCHLHCRQPRAQRQQPAAVPWQPSGHAQGQQHTAGRWRARRRQQQRGHQGGVPLCQRSGEGHGGPSAEEQQGHQGEVAAAWLQRAGMTNVSDALRAEWWLAGAAGSRCGATRRPPCKRAGRAVSASGRGLSH